MSQLTTDLTIKELSALCIKNNVENWEEMSIKEILDTVEDNIDISIPKMSLEAIIEQFPVLKKKTLDINYEKLETSLRKRFGKKLIGINTKNIKKLTVPGTYYMLDLDIIDRAYNVAQREKCLTKITLIKFEGSKLKVFSHNKEYGLIALDDCENSKELMYNDYNKYSNHDERYNYLTQRYIFADI